MLAHFQEFIYIGNGENVFVEDYAAAVDGRPIANVAVVYKNEDGKTQHLVLNRRPLPMLQHFSRKLASTSLVQSARSTVPTRRMPTATERFPH
ncbi:hypothetical protein [Streptomyces sp. NPDC056192]|uniref:hypothetical protein n=1 Tax=Streptomyces sp. NPDC056192 TaxID=3345743 RepID=UPI0035D6B1FC